MSDANRPRRAFLQAAAVAGTAGLAGCMGLFSDDGENDTGNGTEGNDTAPDTGQIGSGREGRGTPGGTPMEEMPELSGTISVYSGRGEPLVGALFDYMEDLYSDLTIDARYDSSVALVNRIEQEGDNSAADVYYTVDAGGLGSLAEAERTVTLPDDVTELVRAEFRSPDDQWIGTSGRARSIPYNTEAFSESDIPTDIMAFPEQDRFDDVMGWAPSYGSFQSFVTAMRVLQGREETKAWLEGMLDSGIQEYSDEFAIAQAVADGELSAGFTNHYYIQRVLDGPNISRDDPPVATAFTENDAGAVFNVAGAAVVDTADDEEMAANFVRHLLSAEAQEYFITETFEYPMIPEAEPIGELPTVDELEPPELDLAELADLEPTIELLREVGITI
ncbi:extracellular solute-binding protein [Halomarina ordinaria]|uniref:Extracellular solute-binding protein n=1 Tax=Halomarina ordinaria TaxID=3033939 RepID=A0ABD5U5Q2_9EURY|nr:extracellular solute-binding protein [Halomarina sp. PSRA2]